MSHRPTESTRSGPASSLRWLSALLRALHLLAIVLLGSALLGAGNLDRATTLVFTSGLAMLLMDSYNDPGHLREIRGVGILVKLLLVGLSIVEPAWALPLFWLLLMLSTLLAHAPRSFRHRRLL